MRPWEALFSQIVQNADVQLDTKRMARERWPIAEQLLTSKNQLLQLYLPWYLSPTRQRVEWNCPDAKPVTVEYALNQLDIWAHRSVKRIFDYKDQYASTSSPPRFDMPAYKVGDTAIILDACHRVLALCCLELNFFVSALLIEGPIDARVLPDLKHHRAHQGFS